MVSDIRAPESEGSLLNPILGLKKKKKRLEMGPIEGKTQTLDPGKSVAGVPISLRCLPWHYRGTFKYIIFAIGWGGGKLPQEQPPPLAGCCQREQSLWAFPKAQPLLPGTQSPGGGGSSALRDQSFH